MPENMLWKIVKNQAESSSFLLNFINAIEVFYILK